jgi:YD repeat-containing protein
MPTEFEDGGLTDFELTTPRVYFLGVRLRFNRRAPLTDPLEANLRVPAAILGEVENPNLYRLLLFDCNGNFIGPAGTFIPPSGEDQTSLLYTGLIDGVYNISHSAALLDSCQYLAIAKGEMITSIKDLSGWSQGFQVENPLPNPFRQKTQISYLLPQSARVDASIIDLLGREVRNLIVRVDQSGTHELEWDGAGDSGEKLTPGLYYLAIKFSDPFGTDFHYIQSKKLVLAD